MIKEPILEIEDVQGNIVPGFRKDSQHFIFLRITDQNAAKVWLKELAPRLSTMKEVRAAHVLWKEMRQRLRHEPDNMHFLFLNCAISAVGLTKLGVPDVAKFDDIAFKLGLEQRAATIGDPPDGSGKAGAPETWKFGSLDRKPDILIILATDNLDWAIRAEDELITSAQNHGLQLIHVDRGRVRPGAMAGHEHFGFKDGVSFPAIRGRASERENDYVEQRNWPEGSQYDIFKDRFAAPGKPLVWPGHFLFGYNRQFRDKPEEERPNSKPAGPDWAKNGSFLVYRRLSQNVPEFQDFLEASTKSLKEAGFDSSLTSKRLGSLLVGRWPSGWPVIRDPFMDHGNQPTENYFSFSEATNIPLPGDQFPLNNSDPGGRICPFAAHIRKVNPRDDATDLGNMERTFQRLMLRRGITFGPELDRPSEERGLIFVSYQSSIVEQFEFVMNDWVNEINKPHDNSGIDPVIGNSQNSPVSLFDGTKNFNLKVPGGWVTPTGGEYMFSPGIRFFIEML